MANESNAALPWDALKHAEGDIPWPALKRFAEALVADPRLWRKLRQVYDDYFNSDDPQPSYECLYVPAILAIAAPRLRSDARREIAEFLADELVVAGDEGDDLMLDVLEATIGTIGPAALPAALGRLEGLAEDHGASAKIWSLMALAADTDDPELRRDVAARCTRALERAERGEIDPIDALAPAVTLAEMRYTEARPLIQRLAEKARTSDLRAVLDRMDGKGRSGQWRDPWDEPVKDWLAAHWETLYDDYTAPPDEDEEEDWGEAEDYDGESDEEFIEEGDEEGEEVTPPVVSKPTVGRNDPCPCGSGKKYKKCCGR